MTIKGGATINSDNDVVIEPINNNILLDLGFESEELEMIEHMSQNEIINKYIETADEEYNINLPDINLVIEVTKRNIAAQTIHNLMQGGVRKRKGRKSRKSKESRKSKKSKRRTYKRRR
jgi:hypothetical protein